MKENEILKEIFAYKFKGNYLNNYKALLSVLNIVSDKITTQSMQDIAIHLVIESRDHIMGMYYSKGYEMASVLRKEIRTAAGKLIKHLPEYIRTALKIMNQGLSLKKDHLDANLYTSWIRYAQPWEYYVLETPDSVRLFVNDFKNNMNLEFDTDAYFKSQIKKGEKHVWEVIYGEINKQRLLRWMKEM